MVFSAVQVAEDFDGQQKSLILSETTIKIIFEVKFVLFLKKNRRLFAKKFIWGLFLFAWLNLDYFLTKLAISVHLKTYYY